MKTLEQFNEAQDKSDIIDKIKKLAPTIVKAVQKVYDS